MGRFKLRWFLILLIWIYRWTLSPLLGRHCRFEPSCSVYAVESLKRYGVFRGLWLTVRRLVRCHPWNEGGVDPIP